MTLSQLEYTLAVAKYKNFSQAANKLSISQPALSAQIIKLENEIGFRLFDRSSSPLVTTLDGREFLKRAEDLITSADSLKSFSINKTTDFNGELKLGIIPTLSPFLVPLFSKQLASDYPEFRLDISEMITEVVIENVRSGELDAGIISTPIQSFGIKSEALFYEKFYFYSSENYAKASMQLEEVNLNDLWILEEGNCFRDQVNDFCNISSIIDDKQLTYRCNSIDSLVRMVDNHGGFTILPELTTISLNEHQEMNVTPIAKKAREIGIITRSAVDKERFIKILKKYILKNIPYKMQSSDNLEIVDPMISS